MIVILWIVFSIIVGTYSSNKKLSGGFVFGFFLSLFFSPVIGLIATFISKPDENKLIEEGGVRKCPHCAELIKKEAIKCRYCGTDLPVHKPKEKKEEVVESVAKKTPEQKRSDVLAGVYVAGFFILIALFFWILT